MEKRNRAVGILKNATSSYARQLIQVAILLLLTPYIVEKVGAADFGLWSLIQATIGLLALMDLGFSASVVKYVADARGRGDAARLRRITATFFWQYAALGAAVLALTLLLAPVFPAVFGVPDDRAESARFVFLLIGLRAAQALPLGLFAGILVGCQQQVLSNLSRVVGTASYGLFAWWALAYSPTIEALAWASLGTGLFANLLGLAFCLKAAPGMSLSPREFRWSLVGEISAFSTWFFLIQISLLIASRVDTIIINAFLPLTAVAVYTVAIRIAEKAGSLCKQLVNTLTPVIAELKGAGEEANIRAVLLKGSMLAVAAAAPLLAGLAWLAEDLVVVWMGEEFRDAALPCRLLLAAAAIGIVHGNTENVLAMTGSQKFLALTSTGGQALNVGLTLVLVKPFGLAGVAAATLASQSVVHFGFTQRRGGRLYRVGPAEFYGRTLWPSVPGTAACLAGMWGLSLLVAPDSLAAIALLLAAGGLCFLPAFWWLGIGAKEREYLGGRLKALAKRKGRRAAPQPPTPPEDPAP